MKTVVLIDTTTINENILNKYQNVLKLYKQLVNKIKGKIDNLLVEEKTIFNENEEKTIENIECSTKK